MALLGITNKKNEFIFENVKIFDDTTPERRKLILENKDKKMVVAKMTHRFYLCIDYYIIRKKKSGKLLVFRHNKRKPILSRITTINPETLFPKWRMDNPTSDTFSIMCYSYDFEESFKPIELNKLKVELSKEINKF